MRGIRIKSLLSGAMLAGLCTASLSASPIFGTFNIAGTITVTASTITWRLNDSPFPPDKSRIGPGSTGSFVGLDGTVISINDLNSVPEPVGVSFPAQPFIAFDTNPALPTLNINFIFKGIYPNTDCATAPAVGQTCTPNPPNSPFNFVNNPPPAPDGPQATATFVFTGATSDGLSHWTGNFTSQFFVPYQTVLAAFGPGGSGTVTNTFSATFFVIPNPEVPEPGAGILAACGLGLVLFSAGLRRRFHRC
ncbi:MAG: hypothetical protein JWP63_6167 [Candidatus Solibacter sp.]|jgi:hypothetical protein|nr:hypothetical protein [Candidatus Solibacter sp.]